MKKLLSLLFIALPLVFIFAACNDDKDLPDVSTGITVEHARILDNNIYVVRGDTLTIASLNIKNNEAGKNAIITSADYYFGRSQFTTVVAPFTYQRPTSADTASFWYIEPGVYPLNIEMGIAAEDKALAFGLMEFNVNIVNNADDIPADATATTTPLGNSFVSKQ